MEPKFAQIHTLTSYPGALLNRDDAGFAKRLPFGGKSRIRISSQCLKRHWRTYDGELSLAGASDDLSPSIRSRHTFDQRIVHPLTEEGFDASIVRAVTAKVMEVVLGQSDKTKSKKKGEEDDPGLMTGQITVLGEAEVTYLRDEIRDVCRSNPSDVKAAEKITADKLKAKKKDLEKNLSALGKAAAGLDAAMFGRMVTSDYLARGDAAVHVAHAFTVHDSEPETDYFSAVDDLLGSLHDDDEESMGAGHIGNTELTSGLFYGYVAVDIPLLISNIEGVAAAEWRSANRTLAGEVLRRLIHIIATVSPGAKLGSTAPHAYAQFVMVELGKAQPRTLANAFLRPVPVSDRQPDLLLNTFKALERHVSELDEMYGHQFERRIAGVGDLDSLRNAIGVEAPSTLAELTNWVKQRVEDLS